MRSYRTEGTRHSRTYRRRLGPPTRGQLTMHRGRERRLACAVAAKRRARRQKRLMRDALAPGPVWMYRLVRGKLMGVGELEQGREWSAVQTPHLPSTSPAPSDTSTP